MLNQIGGTAVLGASALTIKNPSDLYASLFFSRSVQDQVINGFKLAEHYGFENMDDLRMKVDKQTKVDVGRDGIISIYYTDEDGEFASKIANGLIEAMYEIAREKARSVSDQRIKFYDNLIHEARSKLLDSNRKLMEAENLTGMSSFKGQEESTASAIVELKGLIATREVQLNKMLVTATEYHPKVVKIKSELIELVRQLKLVEKPEGKKITDSEGKTIYIRLDKYPELKHMVDPLRKEVEINTGVLGQLMKARALSRIDESRDLSVISILDEAVTPTKKSGPKLYVSGIFGWGFGLMISVIICLAWEILFTDISRRQRWKNVFRSYLRIGKKVKAVSEEEV